MKKTSTIKIDDELGIMRELDVIDSYKIHKQLGNELYGSILKMLEKNFFGKSDQYTLRKCAFSYTFLNLPYKVIKHDCFWINPKYDINWDDKRIQLQITQDDKYKRSIILKIWENKLYLRSVKTIRHYHIISTPNL
ncbi:MAG: hypothetical protein CXT73_05855 [Methanobacteriota archaeon]|nr:MAG: hypothetical protein CXT73_05855 [Euryarchaeota archaeon]